MYVWIINKAYITEFHTEVRGAAIKAAPFCCVIKFCATRRKNKIAIDIIFHSCYCSISSRESI